MATSAVPAFLDALRTRLLARPGLAGVQVATGPLAEDTALESIQVFRVDTDQVWAALGGRSREETGTMTGAIWIVAPGADEPAIKAARDRAYALLAELESDLRADPSVNGTVRVAQLASADLTQGLNDNGRVAQVTFTVNLEARLTT